MAKTVCLLSQGEAAAIREYQTIPDHTKHKHLYPITAIMMIAADLACTVGEELGIKAVVEHVSNNYVWKTRQSGGYNVKQFTRLVQG